MKNRGPFLEGKYIYTILKIAVFLLLFYTLSGISKGGDLKGLVSIIALIFSLLCLSVTKKAEFLKKPPFYFMTAYILVSYLLLPFSAFPTVSFKQLGSDLFTGFSIFLGIYIIAYPKEDSKKNGYDFIVNSIVGILLILLAAGFLSISFAGDNIASRDILDLKFLKFRLNRNEFGMLINFMISFAMIGLLVSKVFFKRLVFLMIILFSIITLFLSLSRGAWISFIVIAFMWFVFIIMRYKRYWIAIAGVSIIVLTIFSLWSFSATFKERVLATPEHAKNLHKRTEIWSQYFEAIKQAPLTGWGYSSKIAWYDKPILLTKESGRFILEKGGGVHAHNLILDILFHQGIIGLIFYVMLLGITVFYIVKGLKDSGEYYKILSFALLCSFVGVFLIHGIIEPVPFKSLAILVGLSSVLKTREI